MAEIKEMSGLGITCSGNQTKKEREKKMTREEALKVLKNLSDELKLDSVDGYMTRSQNEWADEIIEAIERVNEPITLADYLGWEERQVYEIEYLSGVKQFSVVGNAFYEYDSEQDGFYSVESNVNLSRLNEIKDNARKAKSIKRYEIPLPHLVISDGEQQYLTHADGKFFASRKNPDLRQSWKEEDLRYVPDEYRQYAVEVGSDD